jgi:hypothetical protein
VIEQGFAYDLLVGTCVSIGPDWRAGAGVLAGMRNKGQYCPDSYLGYECYADQDPNVTYAFNYGAMLHLAFRKAAIGARASGESLQLMFGIAF